VKRFHEWSRGHCTLLEFNELILGQLSAKTAPVTILWAKCL